MKTKLLIGALLAALFATGAVTAAERVEAVSARSDAHFSDGEIDRLLAPIALYPDSVLTHVLTASTYPLEVVAAARWSRAHPDLKGEDAVEAVEDYDWDESVKALVAFPELLERMDDDLAWTQDLGDAFLDDEGRMMDRVQVLRDRADASGHLRGVEHVRVVRDREYIYLEPAVTEVVYVPYYDPLVVYGAWWWPAYPPYRWTYWGGRSVTYYASYGPFWWGYGFRVAPRFYACGFDWPRRTVVVNHYYYDRYPRRGETHSASYSGASRWQHAPEHRHGVSYRGAAQNERWQRGYARRSDDRPASTAARPGGGHEAKRSWSDRSDNRGDRSADRNAGRREDRGESRNESHSNGRSSRNESSSSRGESHRQSSADRAEARSSKGLDREERDARGPQREERQSRSERAEPRSRGEDRPQRQEREQPQRSEGRSERRDDERPRGRQQREQRD